MGDATSMTIEFLRARLLSERSVSRAARQRADQLATRVMELEEQFRIVTIQRKKAEKAAAEVLAILETQGIGDLSESIDSSSDGEVPYDDTQKEYESSTASRMERSEVEDGLSGTEPEVSPSQGRILSWKSHISGPDSHDKQREKQTRQRQRRRSFTTTLQSSSKHQLGKSCRKIKRKDGGSAGDCEKDMPTLLDAQGNRCASSFNYQDDQPEVSVDAFEGMSGGAVVDVSVYHNVDGDHNRPTEAHLCGNGSGKDGDMDRVLEKQAMLINQFQAEENAQREWEKKYNEKMISPPADDESGNLVHERMSQSKMELSELADRPLDYDEEITPRAVHISSAEEATAESLSGSDKNDRSEEASNVASSNGSVPRNTTVASSGRYSNGRENDLLHQQFDSMVAKETKNISQKLPASAPERDGVVRNAKLKAVSVHDAPSGYPSNPRSHAHGNRTIEDASSHTNFLVDNHSKLPILGPQRKNRVQQQGHPSQAPSSSLGGVLEALQRAKLSLTQELSKMPSPSQGTLAVAAPTNSQTRAIGSIGGLGIPIGAPSLFRLPTDFIPPTQASGARFYASGLSYPTYRPDVGYPTSAYVYPNPTATSYAEAGSRVVLGREYTDNYVGRDPHRYARASSDLSADRTSFNGEISKSYSDTRNGMPPGDRYALYGSDQTRSDTRML